VSGPATLVPRELDAAREENRRLRELLRIVGDDLAGMAVIARQQGHLGLADHVVKVVRRKIEDAAGIKGEG
jgi:hypothetical protein